MRQEFRCATFLKVLVLLALGVVLDPGYARAQLTQVTQTRSVSGEVVTERDTAVTSGATIVVQSRDGSPTSTVRADSQGRFEIPNLSRQVYLLTVRAEGFSPLQYTLDLKDGGIGGVTVRLVLSRETIANANAPLPALTDMGAPKNARKAFKAASQELQAGQVDGARKNFEKALAAYPCYARALAGLASIQMSARELDDAAANLRRAIKCDPGFPGAYTSLGKLLNSQSKFAESEQVLQQGLRLSPEAWQLYDQLAAAHYNEGHYAQARDEWLRVISLDPAPPAEVHAKLAAVYVREGAREKAYSEMQAYLKAEPNGRFASQFRTLMPRLKPPPAPDR